MSTRLQVRVRVAWALWAVGTSSGLLAIALAVLQLAGGSQGSRAAAAFTVVAAVSFLPVTLLGASVALRRPASPLGWLLLVAGAGGGLGVALDRYAAQALHVDPGLPGGAYAAWAAGWVGWLGLPLVETFVLLLFPDGRLPGKRWRWGAGLCGLVLVGGVVGLALTPGPLILFESVRNPVGLEGVAGQLASAGLVAFPLWWVAAAVGAASVWARVRRADAAGRRRLVGVARAATVLAVAQFLCLVAGVGFGRPELLYVPESAALMTIAGAAIVAIRRHGLLELEVLLHRTLLYGSLVGGLAALYVATLAALSLVLETQVGAVASLAATVLVAAAAQPLHGRLARWAARLVHGDREEPWRALGRLGERLERVVDAEEVLPSIVATVAESLRLPFVAIDLVSGGSYERAGAVGTQARRLEQVPLTHRGEIVGRLLLSPRPGDDSLADADRELLRALARHAGPAVAAVSLSWDLQRSRERVIAAREEERRRLRRDLHDGLGPALAGIGMGLTAARDLVRTDAAEATAALGELRGQVREAIAEVRRVVEGLRPAALDELGLAEAVRARAQRLAGDGAPGAPSIAVDAPDRLPPLPAAAEVAAYGIAVEAIANAVRHGDATRCDVRLRVADGLEVEVVDDGQGLPAAVVPGVGLGSMRARAAELGGRCEVVGLAGRGTRVRASIPLAP